MGAAGNFDWWGHYRNVCAIADEKITSVRPICLDLAGRMIVPDTLDVLSYPVLVGKALIVTRFEGYAFNHNPAFAVFTTTPLQDVFPWFLLGHNDLPSPYFEWVSRTDAGVETPVMPPRPQSCFDQNCLLTFPENATAVLKMVDTENPAGSDYGWSFRAFAWLIPAGKINNFQLSQTNFNTNFEP